MVRCADKATSDKVKSDAISTMIFFDGDGKEYYRKMVSSVNTVEEAYQKATEMYSNRPVSWATGEVSDVVVQTRSDRKKLVALAFVDEKKDSEAMVAALEDRWVAKHQDRLVYIKVAFDRTSDLCKKYNVSAAPTLVLVNPSEEDPKKSIVDTMASKKELVSVHAFLVKAFDKFDKASKK